VPAHHQNSAEGAQGRLASVRAQLLPAVSAGGAACAADRHVDQPCGISLRDTRHLNQLLQDRPRRTDTMRVATQRPSATAEVAAYVGFVAAINIDVNCLIPFISIFTAPGE